MKPVPKYLKDSYSLDIHSYKDVPGWINDAEYIYEHAVNKGSDGQIFVEIGTLLGQSTLRMATLIDESNKKIKFDAIDIFYSIPNVVKHSHPVEFTQYLQLFDDFNLDITNRENSKFQKYLKKWTTCKQIYSEKIGSTIEHNLEKR